MNEDRLTFVLGVALVIFLLAGSVAMVAMTIAILSGGIS